MSPIYSSPEGDLTLWDHIDNESQELKRLNRRWGKEYWQEVQGMSRCTILEQLARAAIHDAPT
jgi:hypothetical protein